MKVSRINKFVKVFCISAILISTPALVNAWHQHPTIQPKPSPNAPNPSVPAGLEGVRMGSDTAKQTLNAQNEQEIRLEVQRLYAMASELKDELDKTNANQVLSVSLVKKAQDIEKLAKQIKDRAKH
jgi:hypothetical protein